MEDLDALHLLFLGVHDMQLAFEAAVLDVTYDSTTGLMYIVGAADDDDAPGMK